MNAFSPSRMVKQIYTVRFTTPAFLGDAEQNGAWRTPPFKALLRQWWRVAVAKDYGYDYAKLREAEGRLFGNAWLKNSSGGIDASQSRIKLRLDTWRPGKMPTWTEMPKNIPHPEIKFPIDANLYLGYGPLTRNKEAKKTTFKDKLNATIQAEENNILKIIYADERSSIILQTLQLIHWFGALGGRSRNGWGSLLLESGEFKGLEALNQANETLINLAKSFEECLNFNWPHAFGKDNKGLLIWTSKKPNSTWREAMVELAKIKIAFRTALSFDPNRHHYIDERHILAYPITHHNFNPWCNQSRLANQLRFKVTKAVQGGYIGMAYHLPCSIPNELLNTLNAADRTWIIGKQLDVWQSVHRALDRQMQRIS